MTTLMVIAKEKNSKVYLSLFLSVLIHFSIVLVAIVLSHIFHKDFESPGYVVLSTIKGIASTGNLSEIEKKTSNVKDEKVQDSKEQFEASNEKAGINNSFLIEASGSDSSGLNQIYSEKTLNVKIRYPLGWIYIDQQKKSKLDGVTFWAGEGIFDPPPYIHLEVTDKYYFNPQKFKFSYKFKDFEGFYNEPEELEGQISQTLYIRTESDNDFTIKLIIQGRENFEKFKPVFFAMVNSFQFGSSSWF